MTSGLNRRRAIGITSAAAAAAVLGTGTAAHAAPATTQAGTDSTKLSPAERIRRAYQSATSKAGGTWHAYISLADASGQLTPVVVEQPDTSIEVYSVNKIAVATAVLDKVDRGLLAIDQRVDVTADIVVPGGDGIFSLDGSYPSSVTLGHVLAALLTVSDDTAVRLCGLVCPAAELNQILVAKGFPNTQVEPVANPNRFFLGTSTPRETHNLLRALVGGQLLSTASTERILSLIRSPIAFTDGIRRTMSSDERFRVATKAGWFGDARHEAGMMFDVAGNPVLTYTLFSFGAADPDNFGSTHPAVQARATMGRTFLDIVNGITTAAPRAAVKPNYRPSNGG